MSAPAAVGPLLGATPDQQAEVAGTVLVQMYPSFQHDVHRSSTRDVHTVSWLDLP